MKSGRRDVWGHVANEPSVILIGDLPLPRGSQYFDQTTLRRPMEFFSSVLSIANEDRWITGAPWVDLSSNN